QLYQLHGTVETFRNNSLKDEEKNVLVIKELEERKLSIENELSPLSKKLLDEWEATKALYKKDFFEYHVREKVIKQPLFVE
ncbi:MAG TPA: hypothetical protein VFU62_00175, partial [Hanamia sp.]|nr:hypothetical protein [Hanamia sp.]